MITPKRPRMGLADAALAGAGLKHPRPSNMPKPPPGQTVAQRSVTKSVPMGRQYAARARRSAY